MRIACFAEFYHLRNGKYVEGVGDRSVIIIDGRLSRENKHIIAADECKKRGFDGYRLARGTFTNPFYLTASVLTV